MAFTYKGINAKEMHLHILNELEFESTTRDIELVTVPGRDGDLIVDHGRYESVIRKFPCRLMIPDKANLEDAMSKIHQWLIVDTGSHDLLLDHEPDFIYRAMVDNTVTTNRILSHLGKAVISFRLHPIKFLRSALIERQITSGTNITNPYGIEAKPVLRIIGNGNITINIGDRALILQGIAGGCIVDSETQTITSLDRRITLFERMFSPFPVLRPGNNQVTFSGEDIQVFIAPRLGALV